MNRFRPDSGSDDTRDRRSQLLGRASAITALVVTLVAPTAALAIFFATYNVENDGLHLLLVGWIILVIASEIISVTALVLGAIALRRPPGRVTGVLGALLSAINILWPIIAGTILYVAASS